MPTARSGGELCRRQNNRVGGAAQVDSQQTERVSGRTLDSSTNAVLACGDVDEGAAGGDRRACLMTREGGATGDVVGAACVERARGAHTLVVGNVLDVPPADAEAASQVPRCFAQGGPSLPVQVRTAVTPIAASSVSRQESDGIEEMKSSEPQRAPRHVEKIEHELSRSDSGELLAQRKQTQPQAGQGGTRSGDASAPQPDVMLQQVLLAKLAVEQVPLGYACSLSRSWRTPQRSALVDAQRQRMRLYESAADGSGQRVWPQRECERCVRWAEPDGGPVKQSPQGILPRSVAPASASAFCVSDMVVPQDDDLAAKQALDAGMPRVLVLFAGKERGLSLRRCLRTLGSYVETFEVLDDRSQDLTQRALQLKLLRRIKAGAFDAVFIATPCASFCVALEPQVRSMKEVMGRKSLPPRWRAYLARHNKMVYFTAAVMRAATQADVEWVVENPASQRHGIAEWSVHADRPSLWDVPAIISARGLAEGGEVTFPQCQFGSDYRKYTTLASSSAVAVQLREAFGWASCSCVKHKQVAKGRDEFGDSLSAPAGAYPPAMNAALAHALVTAVRVKLRLRASPDAPAGLHVGSADPHMLRLDDDRVARSRKAPTFCLNEHEPATREELRVRALPQVNVPPVTMAAEEPPPQPQEAPVVRGLKDLLYPRWVNRVTLWMRRCRRCIRLSRQGRYQIARKLRPPDLWMGAEQCMLPSTVAWDWDLRPWLKGEPAVPTARSSAEQCPPKTSFNADVVEADLARGAFTDVGILREMLDGICDDVVGPRGSFLCAPHQGGLKFAEEAHSRLQAGVTAGWAAVYDALPYWPLRCDPYSVVDESERAGVPKFRLTNDHSWPPPATVPLEFDEDGERFLPSLNAAMERDNWPNSRMLRVREVTESAGILASSGCAVRLGAVDIAAFYKNFGRQSAEHHRNGAMTADGVLVDERCCFGSAADATKCCRISNYIVWRARRAMRAVDVAHPSRDARVLAWLRERRVVAEAAGASRDEIEEQWLALFSLGMYVDDAAHASIDDLLYDIDGAPVMCEGVQMRRAQAHYEALIASIRELGLTPTKEQPPSGELNILGVKMSMSENRMWLAPRKREKYAALALEVAGEQHCDRDEYMSLLGKLTFAAVCYPRGRQWLHAAWRAARATFRLQNGKVPVTRAVRKDLRRWAEELMRDDHQGVPLAARSTFPASDSTDAVCIYADAAGAEASASGFGAWAVHGNELLYVEGQWTPEERKHLIIADLELAASTFGLVSILPETGVKSCYSFTDNTVAQAAMRTQSPSREVMQALTAARVDWMLDNGVGEAVERITSKANTWADWLSRGRLEDVLRQAAMLGLRPRRVAVPDAWRRLPIEAAGVFVSGLGSMQQPTAGVALNAPRATLPAGRSSDSEGARASAANLAGGPRGASSAIHGGFHSCAQARPCGARSQVVAQVHGVWPPDEAIHRATSQLAAQREASGGGDPTGLCSVAGDDVPWGQADLSQERAEVCSACDAVAPRDFPLGLLRRPRQRGDCRDVQSGCRADQATEEISQVGRSHRRSPQGNGYVPGDERRGPDVARAPGHWILRPAARVRDCTPAGCGFEHGGASDAQRPGISHCARWPHVRDIDLSQSQGHWRGQGYSAHPGERGDLDRSRASALGHGAQRPGAEERVGDDSTFPAGAWHGSNDRRAPACDQDPYGTDRPRPSQVWGAQPAHRRRDGGAGGGDVPGADSRGGSMGERCVSDIHSALAGGCVSNGGSGRLVGLRGRRAYAGFRRRGADFHDSGDAASGRVLPGSGGLLRRARGRGRGLTRSASDRSAWLAARWAATVPTPARAPAWCAVGTAGGQEAAELPGQERRDTAHGDRARGAPQRACGFGHDAGDVAGPPERRHWLGVLEGRIGRPARRTRSA